MKLTRTHATHDLASMIEACPTEPGAARRGKPAPFSPLGVWIFAFRVWSPAISPITDLGDAWRCALASDTYFHVQKDRDGNAHSCVCTKWNEWQYHTTDPNPATALSTAILSAKYGEQVEIEEE